MMTATEWCCLPQKPYLFLDGARSHKRLLDKPPTANDNMTEIRAWLDAHEEEAVTPLDPAPSTPRRGLSFFGENRVGNGHHASEIAPLYRPWV